MTWETQFSSVPASPPWGTLAVVGLGLIGGSVAMAAKAAGAASRVIGIGRSIESLAAAKREGVIDVGATELAAVGEADLVVLCTPVETIISCLPTVLAAARNEAIVTDAGSTKGLIVAAAEAGSRGGATFVGSHPMAGSDKTGWRAARATLFQGASTFVAVTPATNPEVAARVAHFWRGLGSRVIYCSPDRHDALVAAVSHVPHLAAVSLIEQLSRSGEDPAFLRLISGPGLRDTTRVAKGDPLLWEQICQQNAPAIADALDSLSEQLRQMSGWVRSGDFSSIGRTLALAQELRRKLDRENGLPGGE